MLHMSLCSGLFPPYGQHWSPPFSLKATVVTRFAELFRCIYITVISYCVFRSVQFSSVAQSCPTLCNPMNRSTPGLPVTNSRSSLRLMAIELVMPFNHLILCHPLHLLPSIFPSIRVFSNESVLHIRWPKYWSFSFSISPSN